MQVTTPPGVRKRWVDSVRGIAMLCIVLNHTDIYLVGEEPVVSFDLFGTNALMTFFIVSGYLFFRERKPFSLRRKLFSEFRHLVVPYFIFTTIIAVLKRWLYGEAVFTPGVLLEIVCGQASWFVAARVLAGIIFASLIALSIRYGGAILPAGCVSLAVIPFVVHSDLLYIWNADIALMSLVYLCIGYFYHKAEHSFDRRSGIWLCLPVLAAVVIIKVFECRYGICVPVSPEHITSFPVFFADTVLASFVVITFFKRFSRCRFLNYVGRNSIVFYFLCGGVPLLTGMAFRRFQLAYNGNYLLVLADFAVVVALMSLLTFIIIKFFPFMIGKTRSDIRRAGD